LISFFGLRWRWTTIVAGEFRGGICYGGVALEQHLPLTLRNENPKRKAASLSKDFMETSLESVSQLLQRWSDGDKEALDRLMPLVYSELRRMARRYMWQQPSGHTLQTTALIHEAYLRLVGQEEKRWESRAHFFGVAAQAMRHILVDYARARHAGKRGGDARVVSLEEATIVSEERAAELVALDDALVELARLSPRQGRIVELRYFGGLSVTETADVLKVSSDTVTRDWNHAKAWLHRELNCTLET